jgi:hypothetical protein
MVPTGAAGGLDQTGDRPVLHIVKRYDDLKGFVVLPKRWIVEEAHGRWTTSQTEVYDAARG